MVLEFQYGAYNFTESQLVNRSIGDNGDFGGINVDSG